MTLSGVRPADRSRAWQTSIGPNALTPSRAVARKGGRDGAYGVSLWTTTIVFSVLMGIAFVSWYSVEKTLSIHTITTTRREAFYWTTILVTFASGTAAGDLISEKLDLGYWKSALLFGGLIGLVIFARLVLKLNAVAAFWIAYVLTRPLGVSIGDYLTAPKADRGLGIPTNVVTAAFDITTIVGVVIYFTLQQNREDIRADEVAPARRGL